MGFNFYFYLFVGRLHMVLLEHPVHPEHLDDLGVKGVLEKKMLQAA